ncbi:MAG: hypothetical protein Q8K67_11305 [Geothrix sp.]|nr:hypothetical protein [Geothrix sp.]
MSSLQPVLILRPDYTPVIMPALEDLQAQTVDLVANLQQISGRGLDNTILLTSLESLLKRNSLVHQVTISLVAAVVNQAVVIGLLTEVETVVVKALAGATATLRFGPLAQPAIPVIQGEVRNNLRLTTLILNSPGGAGGTITLELQGR